MIGGVQPGYYTDDVCTPETCTGPGAVPGSCVVAGRFPKCSCLPGFVGNLCETNPVRAQLVLEAVQGAGLLLPSVWR